MKIYSLLLCKNEADIIASVLKDACRWSDKIIVFDNGSNDGTWEIVCDMANQHPDIIIPYAHDGRAFRIGLRALSFDAFKQEMTPDDWWCIRMDADEFYVDNPKDFLAKVPKRYQQVSKTSFDYVLCHEDLQEHNFSGHFEEDKDKIRYYKPTNWAETRFVRHSPRLHWEIDQKKTTTIGTYLSGSHQSEALPIPQSATDAATLCHSSSFQTSRLRFFSPRKRKLLERLSCLSPRNVLRRERWQSENPRQSK